MGKRGRVSLVLIAAALGLLTVAAAPASAAKFTINSGSYPAKVSLAPTNEHMFGNNIRTVTCKKASMSGTLGATSEVVTVTPSYSECTANGGIPATVSMNGCQYLTSVLSYSSPKSTLADQIVNCTNPGKSIEISIYASAANHTAGTKLCVLAVPEQFVSGFPSSGVDGVNSGAGTGQSIAIENVNTVEVKRTTGTLANCGSEVTVLGHMKGNSSATATNFSSEPAGFMVG